MTDDDLIQRLDGKALVASRGFVLRHAERFAPAPLNVVREAQERFGFPLPPLLVRLWSEVANGGIGPGYGIYGLEGGLTDELVDLPLPDLYLEYRDSPHWIELLGGESASRSFPICDWGCCIGSVLDCTLPEGKIILITDKGERIDQGVSFARWIEDG